MVHESFQRFPRVEQSYAWVVNDVAVFIPRILVVPGLKGIGSVNEVEIQILEAEPDQTRFESRLDAFRSVIGVPQLCGDKNIFARDPPSGEACMQRRAYLALVAVSFRAIEVSKSGFECSPGSGYRNGWIGNQGAEAERGDLAGSLV